MKNKQPKPRHLLASYVTVTAYAKKKERTRPAVYAHIKSGGIIADLIGEEQIPMIDWTKYGDYVIPAGKWNAASQQAKHSLEEPLGTITAPIKPYKR